MPPKPAWAEELEGRRRALPAISLAALEGAGVVTRTGPEAFRTSFGKTFKLEPALWARPRTVNELQEVVAYACQQGLPIKPVGSLCTWSPAARPEPTGIALLTDGLAGVQEVETELLRPNGPQSSRRVDVAKSVEELRSSRVLVRVLAGTTIWALNEALVARSLALKTMGAYGGERVGGAFSTGTHGSSVFFGPMCDSAVSLDTVWQGVCVRLERSDGPTDAARFRNSQPHRDWLLVQDDALFDATRMSYGTMGVAFSYLIEVAPLYYLEERRQPVDVAQARQEIRAILAGATGNVFEHALSAEYYFNLASRSRSPRATRVERHIVSRPSHLPDRRSTLDERIFTFLHRLGVDPGRVFGWLFRLLPWFVPAILDLGIRGLNDRFAHVFHRVYNMGAVNLVGTLVQEIAVPAENVDAYLDDCFALAGKLFEESARALNAPVGVRFILPSRALLAIEQPTWLDGAGARRTTRLWGMINFTLTIGTPHGADLLRAFHDLAKRHGGRSHPGKFYFDGHAEFAQQHELVRFLELRALADPDGCFLNAWNRELFGVPTARDAPRR